MPSTLSRHFDAVATAQWSPLVRYGLTLLCVAFAFLLTLLLPPVHVYTPFLLYILAVSVSSFYGGLGSGVLAALLSLLVAPGWVRATSGALPISNPYPLHTVAFVVIASIILLSSYALRRVRRRLVIDRGAYASQLNYQTFLLDHVNDAVCVVDRELCIVLWNRGAELLYGWTAQEALGQHMPDLVRTSAGPERRRALLNAVETGEQQRFEVTHYNKAGALIYVEAVVSALRAADGSTTGYVMINRDATARRKYEQELADLSTHLEQRVRERTAELERMNRELDQFAYIASHDMKAPLRAVANLAEWVIEDSAPVLSDKSRGYLVKLDGRVKRLERLLDDLLAYSRAGRTLQPPEQVDTGLLVQETVDLLNLPPGFHVLLPPAMPVLVTERVPLATVFRNLIQDACKHHNHPERGCVTITVDDLGDTIRFTVADDGPGIAPEYHDQVFELFRTLKPRDQVEGSGMGLSVVKKIVESRGGSISLTSSLGSGASFSFTWPMQALPPARRPVDCGWRPSSGCRDT